MTMPCSLASIWSGRSKWHINDWTFFISFLRPGSVVGLFLCLRRKTLDPYCEIVYLMSLKFV